MRGKSQKGFTKRAMTARGTFYAHVIYKSNECLTHIIAMYMLSVILKRVKPSSRNVHKKG